MRNCLREGTLPESLTLESITFCEPNHKDTSCLFEESFAILQGSFHLAKWKNQDIQGAKFDLLELLENGHVAKIIITEEKHIKVLNKHWQLVHIFHQIFKYYSPEDGFINLECRSIPPKFDKYPDNARHHVKITIPATIAHMRKVNTWTHDYSLGDYDHASFPSIDLMIESDHEDSITHRNVVNLMEA